jgi:hypothetical protein
MNEEGDALVGRKPRWRLVLLGVLLLLVAAAVLIWSQRRQIASDYIAKELARRGVQASYDVKRIGFRTQRLENVVIGDPKRPDATVRWMEVELSLGIRRPRVSLITARGVRLFGRVVNGRVSLGQIDKLLPPPTGKPFRLPNQRVDVADAAIRLDTPAGVVGIGLEGVGNLAFSFEGKVAAVSRGLRLGPNCRLDAPAFFAQVTTADEQPAFRGPLRARSVDCAGVALAQPVLTVNTTLRPGFDGGEGRADLQVARLSSGPQSFRSLGGRLTFDGDAERVRGTLDLTAAGAELGDYSAGRVRLGGRYMVAPTAGNVSLLANLSAAGVTSRGSLEAVAGALASAGGTPLEPIADAVAAAVRRVGQAFDANAALRFVEGPGYRALRLDRLRAVSRSGAAIEFGGRKGLTYYWPLGAPRVDTDFALSGGGFPSTRLSLSQPRPGAAIRGLASVAPMAADGARLQLTQIRFTAAPNGSTRIDTNALLSGPFSNGRIDGLLLPVSGSFGGGGFAFGQGCTPVSFRSLRASGLMLGATRIPLCPTGRALIWKGSGGALQGGASIRQPRLAGRLGQSPITFASSLVRFSLAERGFTSSDVAVRLGSPGYVNRLDLDSLSGRFGVRGVAGNFAGGDAKINNVPLLLSNARGTWSLLGGDVAVNGAMTVSDEAELPRFYPLATNDFALTLKDNRIAATGWLHDPETGTRVSLANIRHDLTSGRGNAVLDVPGIRFDPNYQPEQLTRLTTGVVALVNGSVQGKGEISWGPEGSKSSGTFSTKDLDLAAAFGPVEGLSTTLHFTDLLGLETAPGQIANIEVIRTGIDVFDGLVRYQLLPGLRVRVEGGTWPFAGGELSLEDTILDFSKPTTKRLVFRVRGLDAARFIQQMEFSNITATGTFDGQVPMEFDERGGRIIGGRLIARQEGGTLSYIGELTDKELGAYGKLAFDALKSLRYNKLTINLDGALDGEFIAGIELDGIAREAAISSVGSGSGISGMVARRALGQLAKIPFEFNITIRGPFRALIATARSFEDPSNLIQSVLPPELKEKPATTIVQPQESESVR